ncbi:MAG: carboxymuconolactone decarboxylase family protein [Chloroflexota bacterium]|nr:carboxymuconolactone decarboxylase family protein [Chloroflexota bacterium]
MARIPSLTRDGLDPDAQAVWDQVVGSRGSVRGPMALLMHHPALAGHVAELGSQLRFRGVLGGADRELAILAAGREVEAVYEWAAHEPLGLQEGVRPEAIEILRHQRPTAELLPREALIVDTVRALYRDHRISDELYARAEAELGRQALVELVVLAGYYGLIGFVLNAFEAELPAGATPAFER